MAITRQKLQASLPRIGVVNVNTGADQTWRSVARNAQGIANDFAPFAQAEAEKAGVNAAKAVKRQNLIDFDEDKKPKAFNVPKQFGLVARRAYERVIERRFEESMLEELEEKSIEVAMSAKSSAEYNSQFGNYLKSMDKAADGRFQEYIANTGGSILSKKQLKLEIKEQEVARKKANEYADTTFQNSLQNLEHSAAMTDTTSGVLELKTMVSDATIKAEEKFALTKNSKEFKSDMQKVTFHRSLALVNLIENQSKFFSKSQKLIIDSALTDASEIASVQDSVVKDLLLTVHQSGLPISKLDDLSDHYTKRKNKFDDLRNAKVDEWPEQNQSLIAQFETTDFNSVSDILNVTTFDGAKEDLKNNYIDAQIIDTVQDKLLNFLSTVDENTFNAEEFKINVFKVLAQSNEDIDLSFLPKDLQEDFKQIINLDDDRRNDIADDIEKVTDFETSIIKLEQKSNNEQKEADELEAKIQSKTLHITAFKRIDNFVQNDNFTQASKIFLELQTTKGFNYSLLSPEQKGQYNSFVNILAEKEKKFNLTKDIKQIDRSQILLFEEIENEAKENLRLKDFAKLAGNISQLENLLPQLKSNKRHTAPTIKSLSGDLQSIKDDYLKLSGAEQKQINLNLADEMVKDFQNQAANPTDQNPFIPDYKFKEAKEKIEQMFPDDVGARNNYIPRLQNQYGLSRIEAAKRMFSELYPQGINKNILSEALNAIETQDPNFLKSLKKGSKELQMYSLLSSAKDIYGFKSEFRTQIRGLISLNEKRQAALILDQQEANAINIVETNRGKSSQENIQIYVDKRLKPLLGLDENKVIDFRDGSKWFTEDGRPTTASLELMKLMGKTIIPENLKIQLEQEAQSPTGNVGTLLSLFMFGMEQEPEGERVNLWSKEVTNQLSETAIARYTTAIIRYQLGLEPSAAEAMRNVVNQAADVGEGGIKADLEKMLDVDKLSDWLRETYPEANRRAINILESAAIALGYNTDENNLKTRLNVFTDFHFGIDDKIASEEVPNLGLDTSFFGLGGNFKKIVKGARDKYLNKSEMESMNKAGAELMYQYMSETQREMFFRTDIRDTFGRRFRDSMAAVSATTPIFGLATGSEFYPELDGKERVKTPLTKLKEREPQYIVSDGQPYFYDVDYRFREIADNTGLYYVLIPNQAGGYNKLSDPSTSVPVVMNVQDFVTKEKQHPSLLFYSRGLMNERMNDRTGGQFLQFKGFQPAVEKIPTLNSFDNVPDDFLPLVKAEQAYMFAFRPELLEIESNRRNFEILINEGVIRDFDIDYYEDFLEVEDD